MTQTIPETMLREFSRLISAYTGLYFPESKWNALKKGVLSAARDLDTDIQQLCYQLKNRPSARIIDTLTHHLTIGETYFLRDKIFFQILQDHLLRGITQYPKRDNKRIIFWSAACASGEEPYSLAILVDQMQHVLKDWDIHIFASDINQVALNKAQKGIYSTWSMRGTPERIIKNYFTPAGDNHYELIPRIRKMVQFRQLNLVNPGYAAALNLHDTIDIILCRNVLMYFDEQSRNNTIQNLSKLLIKDGWLITGPAESGFVQRDELAPVRFPNAQYFRKGRPRKSTEDAETSGMRASHPIHRVSNLFRLKKKPYPPRYTRRISDLPPSQAPQKTGFNRYQEAMGAYHRGNYAESIQKLLSLVNEGQNNSHSFLMKTESLILLAKSYANLNAFEKAEKWCKKAIEMEKLNPEIYYLLSTIFQSAGALEDALKPLKQAIYLDSEFIMAHFTLGMLQRQKKMERESRKSLQNAVSLLALKDPEEILPYSEGITAGRLFETIQSLKQDE